MEWHITNLRGSRDGVKNKIALMSEIPDKDKAWICASVDEIDPVYNQVKIDAHYRHYTDKDKTVVVCNTQIIPETVV